MSNLVVDLILPRECLLDTREKDILYSTLLPNEVPCEGCFKSEGCPGMRFGIAVAGIMGIAEEKVGEACPRCGSKVFKWRINDSFRIWRCEHVIVQHLLEGTMKSVCGWQRSEMGFLKISP